jgi:hypothetical protein
MSALTEKMKNFAGAMGNLEKKLTADMDKAQECMTGLEQKSVNVFEKIHVRLMMNDKGLDEIERGVDVLSNSLPLDQS